jgi:oligopeptide/dipeptide ABC transporter ATP-binding protein
MPTRVQQADPAPAASAAGDLLAVNDLSVELIQRGRRVRVVDSVSYTVRPGRTLAIIGESGSGKTVSCRALMGLLPASARVTGSARFEGTELIGMAERALRAHRGRDLSMIFQDPARSLNPTMRVGAQVAEAIRLHTNATRREAGQQALDLLDLVRIPSPRQRARSYPHQMSGGQRQRVMIAMALACRPKLMIADEATTALDVTTQALIMELLLDLQRQIGMAIIFISHDLALAASYADDTVVMYAGRIVESAAAAALFESVRMPYTEALLGAVPSINDVPHTLLPTVPGRPPDLGDRPAGCAFEPRCPYRQEDCAAQAPALIEHQPGHAWACWHPVGPAAGEADEPTREQER